MPLSPRPLSAALVIAALAAPLSPPRALDAAPIDREGGSGRPPADAAPAPGGSTPQVAMRARAVAPAAMASWRTRLMAHLGRYKRFPHGAPAGSAKVLFTIGRDGRVLSAALSSSAGHPALDAEAVAMVQRASPVPPPPDGLRVPVSLTLPVLFRR